MQNKIIEILKDINPYVEINEKSKLIEDEILDSLGLMVLIEELESTFGVKIEMENLQMEWFEDISSIIKMVMAKSIGAKNGAGME